MPPAARRGVRFTGFSAAALVLPALFAVVRASANQAEPVVRFVEGTVFAEPDQRVDMIVEAIDVEDLAGFQVTIEWNPRIVEFVDVEVLEDFMTATGRTIDYTPPVVEDHAVTLAAYTIPPSGVAVPGASGSGEILRLGLRTRRAGRTGIDLSEVLLVNTLNDPISTGVESGQVVVVGPGSSEGIVYMPYSVR